MKKIAEQRAHPRVPTAIPAKISIPENSTILACVVTDLSAGGAGLEYDEAAPRAGLVCLLMIDGFGNFDGVTTRDSGAVRGVQFSLGEADRRRLQDKLLSFIRDGMSAVGECCTRDLEWSQLAFTRANGEHYPCDVRTVSLRGVALATAVRPRVGELVKLERLYGRVVNHDAVEIVIQFVNFVARPEAPPPSLAP